MVSPSAAKMTGVLKRTPDTTIPIKKSASTSFRSTLPFCNLAVGQTIPLQEQRLAPGPGVL
jgi:hypothetical protein